MNTIAKDLGDLPSATARSLMTNRSSVMEGLIVCSNSALVSPPLTAFDQPNYHPGEQVARMMRLLFSANWQSELKLPPRIITMRDDIRVSASVGPSFACRQKEVMPVVMKVPLSNAQV